MDQSQDWLHQAARIESVNNIKTCIETIELNEDALEGEGLNIRLLRGQLVRCIVAIEGKPVEQVIDELDTFERVPELSEEPAP